MTVSRRKFVRGFVAGMLAIAVTPRLVGEVSPATDLSSEDLGHLIAEYVKTSEGRTKLAQAMVQPIKRVLDYESLGRKAFLVQKLPETKATTYSAEWADEMDPLPEPRPGVLGALSRLLG